MSDFVPNPRQKEAIEHVDGPMLVVAGAGTGKTTVLVERIVRLIAEGHARPGQILAVTYTCNAAEEMRQRVYKRLRRLGRATPLQIRALTFHAYCMEILQRCGAAFEVLNNQDLYVYLGRRLEQLRLSYYTRAVNPAEFLNALTDFFSRCHDELVTAADYRRYVERLHAGARPLPRVAASGKFAEMSEAEVLARCDEIARVYETVENWLAADNLGTFGHMVLRAVQLLREKPELLAQERRAARFLLVDEFQDANFAQIELVELLAGVAKNVFAVGDPDQAIYCFRGASNAAFEEFTHRFPRARGVVLEENQRSRTPILRCAFSVIRQNPPAQCRVGREQFERTPLQSARDQGELFPASEPVEIAICEGAGGEDADIAEAAFVAHSIQSLRRRPVKSLSEPRFGVLYRAHWHRDRLLQELAKLEIPFSVTGVDVLKTAPVRDLLACLRALANPADVEAIFRVAALPLFSLDGESVREALQPRTASIEAALRRVPGGEAVLKSLDQARTAVARMDALAAVDLAMARFGFDRRMPALAALRKFVEEWKQKPGSLIGEAKLASLLDYLDWFAEAGGCVTLPDDTDERDLQCVRLMSAHAAKGLEFEHVYVLRANSSSFPLGYRERLFEFPDALRKGVAAPGDSKQVHRQEERRLFYVAMTRARESLAVCARQGTNRRHRPAAFVADLLHDGASQPYRREIKVASPPVLEPGIDIAAAAGPLIGLEAWLLAPPSARLHSPTLSATAVETYESCPLRFKLERDWNIPGPPGAALEYGQAIHSVLKDFYDALRAGRSRALDDVLDLFRGEMKARYFDDPHQRELYRRQGESQLAAFYAARAQEPPPEVLGTEVTFELKIGGVTVRGRMDRVDRVDGGFAVIDYKTGAARNRKYADDSLQLSLYALGARDNFGAYPVQLFIYNLEDAGVVSTERGTDKLQAARHRVLAVAEGMAAGNFEPTRDPFTCRWCEYRNLCPATEQKLYSIAAAAGAPTSG